MAKKRISNYVFLPGVSSDSNAYPNAYSLLTANKTFITKESSAFIASRVIADSAQNLYPNAVTLLTSNKQFILDEISAWTTAQVSAAAVGTTFYGYTYSSTEIAKCKRDMGYLIDALIYDVRYGGNEQINYVSSQYYLSGVVQLINISVEVAIQIQLWNLIINYILPKNAYTTAQSPVTSTQTLTGAAAESGAVNWTNALSSIPRNVISGGLSTLPTTVYSNFNFAGYTYDTSKCERDVGYILDAYANDMRYGGNFRTRLISSRYWDGEVPQIVGDRKTEIVTHQFIRDLITHTVFFGSNNTAKCERDIGYLLDGVRYDLTLGTNYNQVFLGLAEYNSLEVSDTVISTIQTAKSLVEALPSVSSSPTAFARVNGFFSEVVDIAQNGRAAANTLSFPEPTSATTSQIAAKDKLIANRDFLAAEVNAWVALNYPTANHDVAKCTRDLHYAIDAMCYDILYNCNQATYDQAKFFFYGFADGSAGITSAHKDVTVAAYGYFKSIVDDIVKGTLVTKTVTGTNPNTLFQDVSGNNALPGEAIICQNLAQITASVIAAGSQSAANTVLAGITKTYPSVAWTDTALQTAKTAIENAKTTIVRSAVDYIPLQNLYPRQLLNGLAGEAGADLRINTLSNVVTTVIENGLLSLPAIEYGVTTIKMQGYYTLDEILLVTNASTNQFLYNFSDPALGAVATYDGPYDSNNHYQDTDFPQFLQTADYITTLTLKADSSTASPTDDIQIFVEGAEQKVRPYDFGTDAIERMRVAQPQSMLDADFEYGLQPTKWQAIGIARGYPSVYELPGSDTAVLTVTTDASLGTGGIGESLITVTTASPHGFTTGTPITIRSLANTVSGFNRAEGTFIVISVPSPTTFTYYAAAKVGSSNGQILATTYTQLRKGAFYTGASIGQPTITVYNNGQVGAFTTKFITPVGSQQIAVAGAVPTLGVPMSGAGLVTGTQVTGTVGTGGLAITATIGNPAQSGNTFLEVADAAGILEGMAIDNGTGTALFVNSIVGNTINLTGPLTAARAGNVQTYLNVSGTNITPAGAGATFNIDRVSGLYTNPQVADGGADYVLNTRIKILGSNLNGADAVNDAILKVTAITNGRIATFSSTGTSILVNPVTGLGFSTTSGTGTGATFNISDDGAGGYTVIISNSGSNFLEADTITILGSLLEGIDGVNDLVITVTSVTNGIISGVSLVSGISVSGERSYTNVAPTSTSGSGINALFDVQTSGGVYVATLVDPGSTYIFDEVLTFNGSILGGIDGINDLVITVTSTSAPAGGIQTFNTAGTPGSVDTTFASVQGIKITPGTGASFDITRSLGSYQTPLVNLGGAQYEINDKITVLGTDLGGTTTTNDATLTVTAVDGSGAITAATVLGTAIAGTIISFWSAISISEISTSTIADGTSIATIAIATIQATWPTNHGLVPGMSILVDITSTGTNHEYAKGPFFIEQVPSLNSIRYTARTSGTIDTATALAGTIYARPESFFIHRPFDGGVQLGTGGPQHGSQAIRMSKKYIRYQSGKGVMYTTGALFAPSYNLQSATALGTTVGSYITFTTDDVDHGCQVGGKIRIAGIDTAGYNGEYTIVGIQTERVFTVQAQSNLGGLTGAITTSAQMSILEWHGATVRAGTFDDQNGMFWQYDGKQLCVGRRSSTFQLTGVASIAKDTNLVTGSNTRFRDQIKAGDKIVIKGMTHTVTNVASQTQLSVTPDYRGANNCVSSKICLVQELLIPQSQFNLDKLDGTGPSGYNLDITKMQMIGMQWSWYGAGFIDFMLRGSDGNYVFAHRIRNSNVNTEAYMRTGNMPVRYEVHNEGAIGKLRSSISAVSTTIPLVDASNFPSDSGYVYVDNEIIAFSGKSGNTLTGCTRASPMPQFSGGSTRVFVAGSASTHEVNTGVILISNTITPIISHWGSAFLTDGRFDEDRGYIFNYASTGLQASTTKQTAFLIRLAPSVSNAQVGDLGDKELINRAQLLLQEIAVSSDSGTGGLVIEGILNPQNYPVDPTAITWSALNTSSAGGQPSFAQVAPGGSVSWAGGASITTSTATTTASLSGTASVPNNSLFTSPSGTNILYVTKSSWDTLGANLGFAVDATETRYPNGTTISAVTANPNPIATTLGLITGTATIPPSVFFKQPAGSRTIYFTQTSWTSLNGQVGSAVYSNDFPANTVVSNVSGPSFAAGQSYYTITLNNASLVAHNPVQSTLNIASVNVNNNVVTLNFSSTQTYVPYLVNEAITVNVGVTAVNGTATVTACTTTYVQYNLTTNNINNANTSGTVVNTTKLNTTTFFVTGQAASGTNSLNFTQASWAALPIGTAVVTQTVNDTSKFSAGTQISSISTLKTFNGVNYYTVTFNSTLIATQAAGVSVTFNYIPYYIVTLSKNSLSSVAFNTSVPFTPAIIGTNTSFLYFTKASWETLVGSYGAGAGTIVSDPTKFPSGTSIQSVTGLQSFGGTQYYRVNFTQSSIVSITGGSNITFQFGLPPYALPGETVFSFISSPGNSSTLDLSSLKELTNTTLGGRGTYPNGPDVLAINIYKTAGTTVPANLILRWGEAQA